jgi:WXG100 family type VII secretion target
VGATLFSIQMDFTKAKAQANQLEQIAQDIEKLANSDLEECMSGVATNWKGESATAYVKKGRQLEVEMRKSAKELRKIAQTIRKVAKNTYDAEKTAIIVAKNRTYK